MAAVVAWDRGCLDALLTGAVHHSGTVMKRVLQMTNQFDIARKTAPGSLVLASRGAALFLGDQDSHLAPSTLAYMPEEDTIDVYGSAMFSTLTPSTEGRKRRGVAFICGTIAEVLLVCLPVFLNILFPYELANITQHYALLTFPSLAAPEKPAWKPRRPVARLVLPKLEQPKTPALLAPPVVRLEPPKISPVTVPAPPTLATPAFSDAAPSPRPREQVPVRTGVFGGGPELVTLKLPAKAVQTGGFGDPNGLRGQAQGGSLGNVTKLGSFDLPEGPGYGNGTGGRNGARGVIASAGFGSGIAGSGVSRGGGGTGGGTVTTGGFEKVDPVPSSSAARPRVPSPAEFQAIEILSKPTPVYTDEARRLGIQGEVALSVVFQADGTISVLGVVKSLGHGLDQAAEQAATQIRFKPAQRSGQPTDFPATLRIEFRLADQVTKSEGKS